MTGQDVTDPLYWKRQLEAAGDNLHLATWCSPKRWLKHHDKRHRLILSKYIEDHHSVLDGGCAYGRLLDLMPQSWTGDYLGVDVCPEFVELARQRYPGKQFVVGDLRDLGFLTKRYDWVVLCNVKHTILGGVGDASLKTWLDMKRELMHAADHILYLEWAIDKEPNYGFSRICHHDYEKTLLTNEDRDREDREDREDGSKT